MTEVDGGLALPVTLRIWNPAIWLGVMESTYVLDGLLYHESDLRIEEHINLTGDYLWRSSTKLGAGKFKPLRSLPTA